MGTTAMAYWIYDCLADLTAFVHAGVLLFDSIVTLAVVSNSFSRWPMRHWQIVYLTLVGSKSLSLVTLRSCPITRLEQALRYLGTPGTSFECTYIERYLPSLPCSVDQVVTVLLMAAGLIALFQVIVAWQRTVANESLKLTDR